MGNNSTVFDKNAHYESKTTSELMELRDFWIDAQRKCVARPVQMEGHAKLINEELGLVQMKLAGRIGKKK